MHWMLPGGVSQPCIVTIATRAPPSPRERNRLPLVAAEKPTMRLRFTAGVQCQPADEPAMLVGTLGVHPPPTLVGEPLVSAGHALTRGPPFAVGPSWHRSSHCGGGRRAIGGTQGPRPRAERGGTHYERQKTSWGGAGRRQRVAGRFHIQYRGDNRNDSGSNWTDERRASAIR